MTRWRRRILDAERRAAPRVPWSGVARMRIGEAPEVDCVALDLSATGMSVRGAEVPVRGADVTLSFVVHGRAIDLQGQVRWTSQDAVGPRLGIEFTAIGADTEEHLRDYVARLFVPRTGDTLRNLPAIPEGAGDPLDPAPSRAVVPPRIAAPEVRLARPRRHAGRTWMYETDPEDEGS